MKPGDFGVSVYYGRDPMKKPCVNCPFVLAARGEDYLREGRLDDIKFAVAMGQSFPCHKTVHSKKVKQVKIDEDYSEAPIWHSNYRQCAGAIAYAENLKKEVENEVH